jgi:WD40 repeat protein
MATFTWDESGEYSGRATDLSIHSSGERFVSVAASGTVSLWHLETGGSERQVACTSSLGAVPSPRSVYTSARFLGGSSSTLLLSGAGDPGLSIWDSLAGRSFNFSVSGASPASMQKAVPLPGTSLIAVGSSDGSLTVMDLRVLSGGQYAAGAQIHRQTGILWRSKTAHAGGATSLLALPAGGGPLLSTGGLLVTGGSDYTLKVWDCKAAASAARTASLVQEVKLPRAKTAGLQPGVLVGNISQGIGKGPKASPGAGVHTLSLGPGGLYACTAGALAFLPLAAATLPPCPLI